MKDKTRDFEGAMALTPPGPVKTALREVLDAADLVGRWMTDRKLQAKPADLVGMTDLVMQHSEAVRDRKAPEVTSEPT